MGRWIISRKYGRYKIKTKLTSISRLRKHTYPPGPFVGEYITSSDWGKRSEDLYELAMAEKRKAQARAEQSDPRKYLELVTSLSIGPA